MTSRNIKILIVEDDKNMGFLLRENMKVSGFDPVLCTDGQQGFETFKRKKFDICLLDIMLPLKDGLTLATEIRKLDNEVPIVFLTAKSQDEDKIEGFIRGCDDYVSKPFNIEELLLRIRAILKRTHSQAVQEMKDSFVFGDYTLNDKERLLESGNSKLSLSAKEAGLLKILILNKNKLVSRSTILKEVWGIDDYYVSKSLDVYLNKIRKLFIDDPNIELMNVHGYGYKLIVNN